MDFKKNPNTDFEPIEDLSREEAEKEAAALREGIAYHDHLYYVENAPRISDATFDKLFSRLQELEEAWPDLRSATSPTRRVGAPPADELPRVEHEAPMLSLNAALEEQKIAEFFDFIRRETGRKEFTWIAEPKFDGVSVEVIYRKGAFQSGATRGDGHTGEEISANLATVRALPLQLRSGDVPEFLSVRGEVFLPKRAFQELNRQRIEAGQSPFANPRNACAGTLRRLESTIVARWPLDIFFYEILRIEGKNFTRHWEELEAFDRWGLKTNPLNTKIESLDDLADYRERMNEVRQDLPYEIDGIVLKIDDLALRGELGTRHRFPRWAMAWKFAPKREVTVLEEIVVQVGTSGILAPVALLQPVDVGGVTVSRATLHNEDEVMKKDLRAGDRVRIERAGDVIPEVAERIERPNKYAHKFHMPSRCPSCGTPVARQGAYVLCPAGLSCKAQLRGRIVHYGSREALDIEHLGEETASQLVERGMISSLADLYRLKAKDLQQLEGFAEKSARQLAEAIEGARRPPLDRFLYALAIRHVGQRMAQTLARHFGGLENLMAATRNELRKLPDVGPEIACSVTSFFRENRQALQDLQLVGVTVQPVSTEKGDQPLEGRTFVFTGALRGYTRDEAQKAVEALGGRATSSVSDNTDYLVVGENPGSKLDEVENRGIEILSEKEFERLLENSNEA